MLQEYYNQSPPQNIDAEEAILGGILLDPEALTRCGSLNPEHFYVKEHQLIYQAATSLQDQCRPANLMTVLTWLLDHNLLDQAGGQTKLAHLVETTVSAVNIDRYAALVLEKFQRRALVELGNRLVSYAHEFFNPLEKIQETVDKDLNKWKAIALDKDSKDYHLYKTLVGEVEEIEMKIENPGLRRFKLRQLGKKHSLNPEELSNIWFKNLLYQEGVKMVAWAELIAHESEFQRWLLHGFVPFSSLVLLHAPGGTGKTRLFYDWVCCIATGEPWSTTDEWSGFPVTAQERKILIVQTDETKPEMIAALRQRGFEQASTNVRYITNWTTSMMPTLIKYLEDFRPDLVLIDSLSSVNRDSLIEENSVEYAKPVLFLRHLAGLYKCCILLTHHSNRQGDLRGSTAILAAASMVMRLDKDPKFAGLLDDGHRILEITKSRVRVPKRYSVVANFDTGRWTLLGERVGDRDETDEKLPLKDLIIRFLAGRRNIRYCTQELAEALGRNEHSLRKAVGALASAGIISKVTINRRSLYFIEGDASPPRITEDQNGSEVDQTMDQMPQPLPPERFTDFSQATDPLIRQNQKITTDDADGKFPAEVTALMRPECETQSQREIPQSQATDLSTDPPLIHRDPSAVDTPNQDQEIDWHDEKHQLELADLLMNCESRQQLLDLIQLFPSNAIFKAAKGVSESLYEQVLKWLGEPAAAKQEPHKIWDVKVGDRVRFVKDRCCATVVEVQPWGLRVRSNQTLLSWGYSDCEILPEDEDPEILADRLHKRIYEGVKIKVGKHSYHRGLTNKVGVVIKKSPSYTTPQALIRLADGQEVTICLEAAELVKVKTFARVCHQKKWFGKVTTINKLGELFINWEKSTYGEPPSRSFFAEDVEVVDG